VIRPTIDGVVSRRSRGSHPALRSEHGAVTPNAIQTIHGNDRDDQFLKRGHVSFSARPLDKKNTDLLRPNDQLSVRNTVSVNNGLVKRNHVVLRGLALHIRHCRVQTETSKRSAHEKLSRQRRDIRLAGNGVEVRHLSHDLLVGRLCGELLHFLA
jgi:hypothetical protein